MQEEHFIHFKLHKMSYAESSYSGLHVNSSVHHPPKDSPRYGAWFRM